MAFQPHKFKSVTITTPTACKHCHEIISWGIPRPGFECTVCQFCVHKKCVPLATQGCASVTPRDLRNITLADGWLTKMGGGHKSWKKRWCVLSTDFVLYYFKSINASYPSGSVRLCEYDTVAKSDKHKKNGFYISNSKRPEVRAFQFCAESEDELDRWIACLLGPISSFKDNSLSQAQVIESLLSAKGNGDHIRVYRRLYCRVMEGRNLPAMDIGGNSDPYCRVMVESAQFRTSTQWKNKKSPFWDEGFEFRVESPQDSAVVVTVWDEDIWDKDDFIGKIIVPVASLTDEQERNEWHKLQPRGDDEEDPVGDIKLLLTLDTEQQQLSITVIECRNLAVKDPNGFSDPFVRLIFGAQKKKTKVVKKNLNPYFNESFSFKGISLSGELEVQVWDWDLLTANDLIGIVKIPMSKLKSGVALEDWYTLTDPTIGQPPASSSSTSTVSGAGAASSSARDDDEPDLVRPTDVAPPAPSNDSDANLGSIRLKLAYMEVRMLPSDSYDKLLELLLEDDLGTVVALSRVAKEYDEVSAMLVQIFAATNQLPRLLCSLTAFEISQTGNPDIIFRGNTGVTKAVDYFMKRVGKPYLHKTLYAHIAEIFELKKAVEVDESKIEKGGDVKANMRKLKLLCTDMLQSIFLSLEDMPYEMRVVFKNIRDQVLQRYDPEQIKVVKYTAISGFLFLRFFVPALATPYLFQLWDKHAPQHTARTLTLIAKTIQSLSNLVQFGDKEPYMKDMNSFILDNLDEMKGFIDNVVTSAVASGAPQPKVEHLDKELAVCTQFLRKYLPAMDQTQPFYPKLQQVLAALAEKDRAMAQATVFSV